MFERTVTNLYSSNELLGDYLSGKDRYDKMGLGHDALIKPISIRVPLSLCRAQFVEIRLYPAEAAGQNFSFVVPASMLHDIFGLSLKAIEFQF